MIVSVSRSTAPRIDDQTIRSGIVTVASQEPVQERQPLIRAIVERCTTARAQMLEHPNSYALLDGIADSTCQTRAMAPSRSAPKSACASTHPRSKRSSPPPPSPLHLDSNQAGGWRHGGATPPRWSTADIHHESGNKHNTANAVHFGLPAG